MAANERSTVAAVFDNAGAAWGAIHELWHTGFTREQVGILVPGQGVQQARSAMGEMEDNATGGAVAGALTGGTVGAIAGAVVSLMIPGIGPILAGGLLAGVLTGAAAGAAAGSLLGPFVALEMSEDEAKSYEQEFRAGRTVVVVKAPGQPQLHEAQDILAKHGGRSAAAAPLPASVP